MRFALAILLVFIAGCGGGPDVAMLRRDVTARLDQALPPDTVAVASLERKGSQSDPGAPQGETRRTIYFDAELRLTRDFDFGAWDAPGIAGLVSAFGAGPKGISGITPGGNKAGDVLRIHGTALYSRVGTAWQQVVPAGYEPEAAPAYATTMPQHGVATAFEAMRKVVEAVPVGAAPAQRAIIEEEMTAAAAAIRSRLARAANGYAIAAGPEHGQYLRLAQALAKSEATRIVPLVTRGGDDNLRLLRDGKATLAMSQADAALDAYRGRGSFAAEGPYTGLRAIGSLYPEPIQVLVRGDGNLRRMANLAGRRVAIGPVGSAARLTALSVLAAHGLRIDEIRPLEVPFGEALPMLQRKEIDAVIHVIGVPSDSVRAALLAVPLRLVPLSGPAIEKLVGGDRAYIEYVIPRGVYATQDEDVRTIATTAVLLAAGDLSETEITAITGFVFGGSRDLVALGSAQGAQISATTARRGLPIPLHPSAAKKLDELAAEAKRPGAAPRDLRK
jgi:TRAP transporter TAXI family solute receptor